MSQLLVQRREMIILDAIDAIDKYGIQSVSTKKIAEKQGISERLIFNHFPKKSDLILAVLDYYSKYDESIVETIRKREMALREALIYFIECYSIYYQNYPAMTAIAQSYDILQNTHDFSDKVKTIFTYRSACVQNQIEKAKELGKLRADIESEEFTDIILGTFNRICLKWRMNQCSFLLKDRALSALKTLLDHFELK